MIGSIAKALLSFSSTAPLFVLISVLSARRLRLRRGGIACRSTPALEELEKQLISFSKTDAPPLPDDSASCRALVSVTIAVFSEVQ